MLASLDYLWLPWLLCLLLTGMHAYLGLHVLRRGVIFVDLALAQVAAFGVVVAMLAGLPAGSVWSHGFALTFTLLGAAVLASAPVRTLRVPQEATIGVVYAMAAAACALLFGVLDDAHAAQALQATLTGQSMVWVTSTEIVETALLYALVAIVHVLARRPFAAISRDAAAAQAAGYRVRGWDFVFYASFGVVITSSVQVAGVLVVFAFLIVPAVIGALVAERDGPRLLVGWLAGAVASFAGLLVSYRLPSGPSVVLALGTLLAIVAVAAHIARARARGRTLLRVGATFVAVAGLASAIAWLPWRTWAMATAQAHTTTSPAAPAVTTDTDPDATLRAAVEALARGDRSALRVLGELAASDTAPPFFRDEAFALLRQHVPLDIEHVDDATARARLRATLLTLPAERR